MRFMVLAKADEESEAGGLPDDEYAEAMIRSTRTWREPGCC